MAVVRPATVMVAEPHPLSLQSGWAWGQAQLQPLAVLLPAFLLRFFWVAAPPTSPSFPQGLYPSFARCSCGEIPHL